MGLALGFADFLATSFLGCALAVTAFLAGDFFAGVFFAGVFFAGAFFAADFDTSFFAADFVELALFEAAEALERDFVATGFFDFAFGPLPPCFLAPPLGRALETAAFLVLAESDAPACPLELVAGSLVALPLDFRFDAFDTAVIS